MEEQVPPPLLQGPKRHHYLPRFYQEGFAGDDECVAVYDREKGASSRQQPVNTAVIGHYYTMTDEEGRKRFEIEQCLSQIEGDASQIMRKLIAGQRISDEERMAFASFVALSSLRTPDWIDSIRHANGEIIKQVGRVAFGSPERAKANLQANGEAFLDEQELEESAKRMSEFINGGNYEIEVEREWALQLALPQAADIAPYLHYRRWQVLIAPPRKGFITADAPVYVGRATSEHGSPFRGVGFGSPNAVIYFPLDHAHSLLMFGDDQGLEYRPTSGERIRELNIRMARNSKRYLVGRDSALVESIAQTAGVVKVAWKPKIQFG
jgi:hypothetical protein